jgi:hypothetical protein
MVGRFDERAKSYVTNFGLRTLVAEVSRRLGWPPIFRPGSPREPYPKYELPGTGFGLNHQTKSPKSGKVSEIREKYPDSCLQPELNLSNSGRNSLIYWLDSTWPTSCTYESRGGSRVAIQAAPVPRNGTPPGLPPQANEGTHEVTLWNCRSNSY